MLRQREWVDALHDAALARYASGTASQGDALAAESEQTLLLHREVELSTERTLAAERINTLYIGRRARRCRPRRPSSTRRPRTSSIHPHWSHVRAERRPEVRERAAAIREREASLALARREFLPDFTLRGAYEGSWQETPLKPFVGVELNLPIQLERRRAAVDEAEALLARERSLARRAEADVRLDVTRAIERLREASTCSSSRATACCRSRAIAPELARACTRPARRPVRGRRCRALAARCGARGAGSPLESVRTPRRAGARRGRSRHAEENAP